MIGTTDNAAGFAVVDWETTFEVDDKGGPWKEGRAFRNGSLNYLRMPMVGTFARRWAMIARVAGDDALWVRGLFDEFLRLVAGVNRPDREGGVIRGVDGRPASVEEIAECLGLPPEKMSRAVGVLVDRRVGLLREVAEGEDDQTESSEADAAETAPGESSEFLGNPRSVSDDSHTEAGAGGGAAQRQEHEQEEGQRQEQPPGDSPDGSARLAFLSFDSLLTALRSAYGDNRTIGNFAQWLLHRYRGAGANKWREVSELVKRLIAKSKTADGEPAAFFIGAVKKSPEDGGFGYRPKGTAR